MGTAGSSSSSHQQRLAADRLTRAMWLMQVCSAFDGMQREAVANKAEGKAGQPYGMLAEELLAAVDPQVRMT